MTSSTGKLNNVKLAFLYVLTGGLIASALIAMVTLLVGEFNSALGNAFGTILVFVAHSLFILGLIWSDKNDAIGRKIIPTTILATALANLATSTLGIWGIVSGETSGRAMLFYSLLVGTSFIVSGALKLRTKHKATNTLLYSTIGSVLAWALLMTPWVFQVVERFNPLYYRIAGALTILMVTLFMVSIIIRSIANSQIEKVQGAKSKSKEAAHKSIPGALLAYYIGVGLVVGVMWLVGMLIFIVASSNIYQY